jgi:hypothetical protein
MARVPRHAVRGGKGRFTQRAESRGTFFDTFTPMVGLHEVALLPMIREEMRAWGRDAVAYMKANAPWSDRTGEARAGLDYSIDEAGADTTIYLFHSVSYGKWLEIRWNGRYAIILPTIEALGHELNHRIEARL